MANKTLVILAAGMASRYGSLKQIESFGPSGETIIEYSIYDTIRAGFDRVIFIIREDFFEEFKEIFEPKLKERIEIDYAFQKLGAFTEGFDIPSDRSKPFGTAQALMCCGDLLNTPFAIINADDFYGAEAFQKAIEFLDTRVGDDVYASIAYKLENTLSDNGSVSRGQIFLNEADQVSAIKERLKIFKKNDKIVYCEGENNIELSPDTLVSMNFFCFAPSFVELCKRQFKVFLEENIKDIKSEFLMPIVADTFIQQKLGVIEVIPTNSQWFGVTYKEDSPFVKAQIEKLVEEGTYPNNLWR
jgi:NDP-sugar pyrophosphorylase family protein